MTGKPDIFNCLPTKLIEPREKPQKAFFARYNPATSPRYDSYENNNPATQDTNVLINLPDGYFE